MDSERSAPDYDVRQARFKGLQEEKDVLLKDIELLRLKLARAGTEMDEKDTRMAKIAREMIIAGKEKAEQKTNQAPLEAINPAQSSDLDVKIRSLTRSMIERRIPLYSVPAQQEPPVTTLCIHTVKVHYLKHLADGHTDRLLNGIMAAVVFRLTKSTTLRDLHRSVCRFWVRSRQNIENSNEVSLRTNIGTRLGLVDNGSPLYLILQENLIQPEFWLIKDNPWSTRLFPGQDDFCECYADYHETGPSSKSSKAAFTTEQLRQGAQRNLKALAAKFPGLNIEERMRDRNEKAEPARYFACTSTCATLLLFLFTLVLIIVNLDTERAFEMNKAVVGFLDAGRKYSAIGTYRDLSNFMEVTFPKAFFPSEDSLGTLTNLPFLVGPVRLRQVRSRKKDCPSHLDSSMTCYEDYSPSTRSADDLIMGQAPWTIYRSEEDTHTFSVVRTTQTRGLISDYDGSGYVSDFYTNTTAEGFTSVWDEMKRTSWVDGSTRALMATASCYEPSLDMWWRVQVLVEFSNSGGIYPNPIKTQLFQLDLKASVLALGVLRLLLSLYLPYFAATEFAKRVSFIWRFDWKYLLSLSFFRDISTFVLILAEFGMSTSSRFDSTAVLISQSFYDFQDLCELQSLAKAFNMFVFMLLYARLTKTLHIFTSISIVLKTMRKVTVTQSVVAILPYLLLLLPSIIGLAVTAYNVWGAYSLFFSSFKSSVTSTVLASIGLVPLRDMFLDNSTWTAFFLIYAVMMFSMYMVAAFRGIYLDTRLLVRQREGYVFTPLRWTRSDAVWWFAGVLPMRVRLNLQHWWRTRQERRENEAIRSEQVVFEEKREETDNPVEKDKTELIAE